jgi:DNA-cytosine methyltransferase
MNTLNVIDLFCGCGGMSKGLYDAGFNIIAGIDIWDKAINNYKKNFHHYAICADLLNLSPEKFNNLYNKENKIIDLIVGGPPCQGFSIAGKRNTKDPRNSLFMEYVKYINYYNPKSFIMENVMGILSMKTDKNEKFIDIILSQFNINYNCIITKLYASDFEVPQNRRRVIIIGIRKDLNIIPDIPKPILTIENRIPIKNILLPKNEVTINHYLSEKAMLGIQNKKKKSKEKGNGFGAQFLDLDKPSYTIPARYWKDGYDALVKYNDKEIRRLTILELKRIQTFPDNYILEGSKKDIIIQIGNAVACKFAYHLGKYIINILQ